MKNMPIKAMKWMRKKSQYYLESKGINKAKILRNKYINQLHKREMLRKISSLDKPTLKLTN